jgi:hypothetical protein
VQLAVVSPMQLIALSIICFVCTIFQSQTGVAGHLIFGDMLPAYKTGDFALIHLTAPDICGYLESLKEEPLEWIDAVVRGRSVWNELQSALERNPKDKLTWMKLGSWRSNDPWRVASFHPVPMLEDLKEAFEYLNLPWSPNDFYTRIAMHDHVGDIKTWYQNIYNVKEGIIIAEWNKKPRRETLHWSQVTFELWSEFARLAHLPVSNLKWIVRHGIENQNTQSIIIQAYLKSGTNINSAPNIQSWTLRKNRDAFYALLGTVNGKGVAHFLKDYTKALDRKTIQEIFTVKAMNTAPGAEGLGYHMVFRLGPVSEAFRPIGTNFHGGSSSTTYASTNSPMGVTDEKSRGNRILPSKDERSRRLSGWEKRCIQRGRI